MSGWVEYQKMPENTTHIAYVQENGEVYLPEEARWERAGASALLEHATPLIRLKDAVARLAKHPKETPPPYMFPDVEDEPFPGMRNTTYGEVLNELWECAFEQAIEVVREVAEEDERERKPTEAIYDIVLGVCKREHEGDPPWCMTHASWIQRTAPHCDRRHFLQRTVEHVLKTMEGQQ